MRRVRRWAAVALIVMLVLMMAGGSARATPVPDQCKDPTFARANPGLCGLDWGSPFGVGGGGGGSGGVLGGIGKIIGGLTGGLL